MTKPARRAILGAASGPAAALGWPARRARAASMTFALVRINQQALFLNQKKAGVELVILANDQPAQQNNAVGTDTQQRIEGVIVDAIAAG